VSYGAYPNAKANPYAKAAGRYGDDAVTTASPARLLVMLFDRLVLDLARAERAVGAGDRSTWSSNLQHAQDILAELLSSLDQGAWDGGPGLAGLYTWMIAELTRANVGADAGKVAACRDMAQQLRDAWAEAAASSVQTPSTGVLTGLAG
jgi:flagellar protein FliS